ncbi:MAG TPA: zf-HC2 domain-containing protein [Methylomirabilota bacterium]|nr:zf-HC2 domain-containing protein [Methylomirabilota bacterium]
MDHPRTELIPYLRGELPPVERESVETHLAGCRACRAERDAFAELLLDLRRSLPETPPLDWARWHADLRVRLRRRARRPWLAPLPLAAASATLAAGLVVVLWLGVERHAPPPEMVVAEAPMLMEPVEALAAELPEDIDLIVQLDRLTGGDG